jgi:DNA-binding PadR family transcriptional regulator
MLGAILGNTATQIAGRLAGEDASRIARNWERNSELEKAIESRLVTLPDWTFLVREQAQPGKEQQPPYQVLTLPPPEPKRSYDDLKHFMAEMKQRYGLAKVEKSLFSAEARMKWMSFLSEDYPALPTRETWLVLTALEKKNTANKTEISRMTALERDSPGALQEGGLTALLEKMKDDGLIEIAAVKKRGPVTAIDYRLSNEGERLLSCDYAAIGKEDAQEIATKAREYYVSHGQFFQVCRQDLDMPRKPDAAAYDYLNGKAIAVEIESPGHVDTHADQLMRHFQEVDPFSELHVWIRKESEAKVQDLIRQLPADQAGKVRIYAV